MQLSLKVKGDGAEAVSFLLAKNPANLYERDEKGLNVRLVYTIFSNNEVEFLLYVKPDSFELVRNSPDLYDITHYINDREFAASSIFVSSIRKALGTALNGKPKEEYESWVSHPFDLELSFGPVATDIGDIGLQALFEPIGYEIQIERGQSFIREKSSARFITLTGTQTIQNALKHISILIPVIDNYKHYFIDEKEIEKLDRYGEGWLENHPSKEFIVKRTLRFQNLMMKSKYYEKKVKEVETEPKVRLNDLRYEAIINIVKNLPHRETVVDLGAGEGKLSVQLGFVDGVREILSVEPSNRSRLKAMERFDAANGKGEFTRPDVVAGSLFYYDERLAGKDVMILCEVIEHIDEYRLPKIMETILRDYRPGVLIVTTPNQEYNDVYQMDSEMRHSDHRFEWTREEFQNKCLAWSNPYPYEVNFHGIGEEIEPFGFPTQLAIFHKGVESE